MVYNRHTAERVRQLLGSRPGITEKTMFGGVGFLLYGNMCVGVWRDSLILRIGKDAWQDALQEEFVHEFDITGRSMTGWVMVEEEGFDTDTQLSDRIAAAMQFVTTLPPK
jgi:TfoX/Sxy family transcriptional regulator of competence genes